MNRAASRIRSTLTTATGTSAGASSVLAVLVIASVFIAMAASRQSLLYRTRALRLVLTSAPAAGRTIVASLDYTSLDDVLAKPGPTLVLVSSDQIAHSGAEMAGQLTSLRLPLAPASGRWWGVTSGHSVVSSASRSAYYGASPPQVQILCRNGLARFSRLAAGRMPAASRVTSGSARFQVAVTAATAARFGLHPGAIVHIGQRITLIVSGIIRPAHRRSSFWTEDPDAAAAALNPVPSGMLYWLGSAFIAASELGDMERVFDPAQMRLTWEFPLTLGGIGANQAGTLRSELSSALVRAGVLTKTVRTSISATMTSGLVSALDQFVAAQDQVAHLVLLLQVSLAIIGAVVVLLGGRLLAERRATEFGLMRARGAARGQLGMLAFLAAAVVVLPAAAAGALVAVALTPGADEPVGWWLAALTVILALTCLPVLAVRAAATAGQAGQRPDGQPSRATRARRVVAELTLAAVAVGGLAVFRQQGVQRAGADWFTSAAPVLVAIPVAVVVVRCYPLGIRWLVRLAGRRRGVTAFVGLARACRASATSVLPAFALVLVLTVVAFGAMLRAAVVSGDVAASWRAVGADAIVDASQSGLPLGRAAQRAIAAVPGVRRACPLSVLPGLTADGTPVAVVVLNPARYAAMIVGTPLPAFPAGALARSGRHGQVGSVPVLAAPAPARLIGHGAMVVAAGRTLRVRLAGIVPAIAGSAGGSEFIVVPDWAMGAASPTPDLMLVVGNDVAAGTLRAVAGRGRPGVVVTTRSALLASLASAPLPHGTFVTFAQGTAAAAGFGVVIVAIMLALGARPRELTLARLITMGLSGGQARWLVVAEALPLIIAATAGGAVAAVALVPLLGPAIDLLPLTGSSAPVPLRADLGVIGYLAAGLLVLAIATLFAQAAATRLRGVARAMRAGE